MALDPNTPEVLERTRNSTNTGFWIAQQTPVAIQAVEDLLRCTTDARATDLGALLTRADPRMRSLGSRLGARGACAERCALGLTGSAIRLQRVHPAQAARVGGIHRRPVRRRQRVLVDRLGLHRANRASSNLAMLTAA